MHRDTKSNTQDTASPPLPPAAVFDEQHMAAAQPVQLLRNRASRKLSVGFQYILGRRFTTIATIIAGMIICIGVGAASVDWASGPLSSQVTAQIATEPPAPSTAAVPSNAAAAKRPDQKRRSLSIPQAGETLPPYESVEGEDNRKPRARMVSVIH